MNKEYKIMTALIPIILILSITLYLFPGSSGITTQLEAPLLNQTNNTTTNVTTQNQTTSNTQTDTQSSQSTNINSGSSSNYNSNQGSNNNYNDNNSYTPTEPTTPTTPTTDNDSYPA